MIEDMKSADAKARQKVSAGKKASTPKHEEYPSWMEGGLINDSSGKATEAVRAAMKKVMED